MYHNCYVSYRFKCTYSPFQFKIFHKHVIQCIIFRLSSPKPRKFPIEIWDFERFSPLPGPLCGVTLLNPKYPPAVPAGGYNKKYNCTFIVTIILIFSDYAIEWVFQILQLNT